MRRAAAGVAAAVALLVPSLAHASATHDVTLARRGLAHAQKRHWLKAPDVAHYRTLLNRALWDERRLPKLRAATIASQLSQLTPLWDSYVRPRALALFTQLEVNLDYLETHRIPAGRADVSDGDGVVYRWFPGHGLEFHPLASFSALNNAHDPELARVLADALVARGVPHGDQLVWEYSFRFGSGRPPWASGMAQAVAAQALARAGALLADPALSAAAARAFASVPGFLLELPSGPWIRLYGFTGEVVLNAQLQSAVSLLEYGTASGDTRADELANRLLAATQSLFPRFDTGDWSRYELGGAYASRDYQAFVTTLLARLASKTQDPFWVAAARRFRAYLYEAPQIVQTEPSPPLWPQPQDGFLDTGAVSFTLSQKASVTLAVAGKISTYRLGAGPHTLTWKPPAGLAPGAYPVQVSTLSYAGNRATFTLQPLLVQWDTQPPPVTAQLAGAALTWASTDPGTPWLALAVDLVDPTGAAPPQTLDLGRQTPSGTVQLAVPPGTWEATLRATNSAGLTTTVPLGSLQG